MACELGGGGNGGDRRRKVNDCGNSTLTMVVVPLEPILQMFFSHSKIENDAVLAIPADLLKSPRKAP